MHLSASFAIVGSKVIEAVLQDPETPITEGTCIYDQSHNGRTLRNQQSRLDHVRKRGNNIMRNSESSAKSMSA